MVRSVDRDEWGKSLGAVNEVFAYYSGERL